VTVRVVVFDFDGVLVDSNAVKRDAYFSIFARFGDTAQLVAAGLEDQPDGNRYQVIDRVLCRVRSEGLLPVERPPEGWVEHLAAAYNAICEEHAATCLEVPGATECLTGLVGRSALFVNSATLQEPLRRVVRRRGWEPFFRGIYGAPTSKANHLRHILAAEGVRPAEVLLVGDGRRDLVAAQEVGARFVGVHNPFNDFDPTGLVLIDDLFGLPRLLAEAWEGGR